MALQIGINSFVTLTEAQNYFDNRINSPAWDPATNQSEALVTATSILNRATWLGTSSAAENATFKLSWPRNITVGIIDPLTGLSTTYADNRGATSPGTIPEDIKTATFELAYHLINNTDLLDATSTVADLTIGSIRLLNPQRAPLLPFTVVQLIGRFVRGGFNFREVTVGV